MKFTQAMFAMALGSMGVMQSVSAHAWDLSNGDSLTITSGTYAFDAYDNYAGISSDKGGEKPPRRKSKVS